MSHVMVTIVAPESRETTITADLKEVGVKGWTAWTVRGVGAHGFKPTQWSGANVRIELFVEPPMADAVVAMLLKKHPRSQAVFVATVAAQVHG